MNYAKLQKKASKLITKYGMPAILRRGSSDRDCIIVVADYMPEKNNATLRDPVERVVLMSAQDLDQPPIMGKDILVTINPETGEEDENLKITKPPGKLAPGGPVIYWELTVKA